MSRNDSSFPLGNGSESLDSKCSSCKENAFDFILFRQGKEEVYHYHSFWSFDMKTKSIGLSNSLFEGKNKEEILDIVLKKFSDIEVLGLFCSKCAQKGVIKYEFFRKFKGDKPLCYYCNKAIYQINNVKHPMLTGFNAIRRHEGQNLIDTKTFHKDRVLYD